MHALRTFRMSALVAASALVAGTVVGTATVASAAPHKPGKVTGLAASADATSVSDSLTSYAVSSSWNPTANAASYKVTLTKGGTTLRSVTVTGTSYSPTVQSTPGAATLSVRAVNGHRKGTISSVSIPFGDVNAPTGTFTTNCDKETGGASVTVDTLTDDSGSAGITRTVDWNLTGLDPVAWSGNLPLTNTYPLLEARYVPTVTLEDGANNLRVLELTACVVKDELAPTGAAYTVNRSSAWAGFTKVTVNETAAPTDNWSPTSYITRVVDWGDGTTTPVSNGKATHKYATPGDYSPFVTVTDEAHNFVTATTSAVAVTVDAVAPTLKLTLPQAKHSVKAWRTLRGKAVDAQTGVKKVSLKAVEKRATGWFGYNAVTQKWVKAASKSKAFARSKAFSLKPNARHRWAAKLVGLAKGTLVYKTRATDNVGNRGRTVTHSATLTRR
jgi:hypothetical protein